MQFSNPLNSEEKKLSHSPMRLHLAALLVCVVVGLSFYGGTAFGRYQEQHASGVAAAGANTAQLTHVNDAPPKPVSTDVDFRLFWDVWNMVKDKYVEKGVSDKTLFYGALSGIVSSVGDPYTVFFDPETAKKFNEDLEGSFDGIGVEIGFRDAKIAVIAPLPGSPGEQAGLKGGDYILKIDGKSTTDMKLDEAVGLIRGKSGTKVVLTIFRDKEEKERDITVTRDKIQVKSVKWEIRPDGIAVVSISHFNRDTEGLFKDAVAEILSKRAKGIVLDLRNDPGGFLDTAIKVSSYWVDGGTVVSERYKDGTQDVFRGVQPSSLKNIPTVVLVNEWSASASEIVSGALQDNKKATIVGKKTFGKGSVQDLKTLSDGSAVKITIAKWYTPNGNSIHEQGIKPDVVVEPSSEKDLKDKKDAQLQKALEILGSK